MDSDETLLAAALTGDEAAFAALYRRRQGAIYRFGLHMSGDCALAEDVTQEVFLALLQQGSRFDPSRGPLLAFLYGIARHHVLRRIGKTRLEACASPVEVPSDEDILDAFTRRESIEQVRRAVLSLPEVYREAIVLCDLENTSYEEAALALDCPLGTVRSRLSRARAMLAQKLSRQIVRSTP